MINKRYIINKKIGEGRSKVFKVIDTEFPEREVAAKFLPANASNEEKKIFREEYFTLQRLDHPNIIKAFELNSVLLLEEDDEQNIERFSDFITMEYQHSIDLLNYNRIKEEKQLNLIIKQICSVLYYLHQSNYIYYDLKVENILVAENKNTPLVKLIDLGFAKHRLENYHPDIKGTPFYLAPELLKNEIHDHRVDFYSLGILLYKVIYDKFPFNSESEIEIYKSHIEEEFKFENSIYSKKLISVVAKLLSKNPADRYHNALEILIDLQIPIDIDIVKDFLPAKVFSDRKDAINILNTYIKDKHNNEVFTVSGFDGSGRTALLQEILRIYPGAIYIENPKTKSAIDAIKYIIKKIIISHNILTAKNSEFESLVLEIFDSSALNFFDAVKKFFNTLPFGIDLIILLDDFNLYDSFVLEILTDIIKIFQVKGIKVILTESPDYDHSSGLINNLVEIQLNQFTEHQLSEFLQFSYNQNFPLDEFKKYILHYSDLLPGNIKQFIKDLILLRVLRYDSAIVIFETSEDIILALRNSHEEIYRLRLSNLNSTELKLAQIISAFEIAIEQTVIAALMAVSPDVLKMYLYELEKKNIIESLSISNAPKINSYSFKQYIYSTINNKSRFHLVIASSLINLFPDFSTLEVARQYERAGEYEKTVDALLNEANRAEEMHAYNYKKSLLEKCLKFPLKEKTENNLLFELTKSLYKLSDYKNALENLYRVKNNGLTEDAIFDLSFIKGSCLIELQKTNEGIDILAQLKSKLTHGAFSCKILVEIAYAEFDRSNIEESESICFDLLKDNYASLEDQGRALNLLSIIESQIRNQPNKSLNYSLEALSKYEQAKLNRRIAGIHVNLGILYGLINNKDNSIKHWDLALSINSQIGNLEQEGSILINYAVYHQNNNNYEKAVDNLMKAKLIFSSTGHQYLLGVTLANLGEVNLLLCDYQNCNDNLTKAFQIFNEIKSFEDQLNCLFLMGKLWFIIDDKNLLSEIINKFELLTITQNIKSDKIYLNQQYLKLMITILKEGKIVNHSEIIRLLERCIKEDEKNLFTELITIYSEFLIINCKFEAAIDLLNQEKYLDEVKSNTVLRANQYYLLGKIARQNSDLVGLPAIKYFENAYVLLEDQSVTELTWKVLFEIADFYSERGNFHKAKKPRIYAFELINIIGDNIVDNKIRSLYFNKPVRKKVLEKLISLGNQVQYNEFHKS